MKIVHVLVSPRIGGAEVLVSDLDEGFKAKGLDSNVVYLDDTDEKQSRFKRAMGLRKKLKSSSPNIILAHSFLPSIYTRMVAPRKSHIHYVLHSASDDYSGRCNRVIERILLTRTKSVIAVSTPQLAVYKGHFGNAKESIVIQNGVGERFSASASSRELPSPVKVVTIARVSAQKRPEFWLQVVQLANEKQLDFRFEWWGPLSGDPRIDCQVLSGLPANAFFMGPTNSPEKVLVDANIVFQTSDREASFSLAILEAALVGRPQIYSSALSIGSFLSNHLHAYTNERPESALEKLIFVAQNWAECSQKAHDYAVVAVEQYGIEAVIDKYLSWVFVDFSKY